MTQSFIPQTKFRPYFTAEELSHIISLVQSAPDSEINRRVFSYLQTFAIKINHSIVKPAIELEGTKKDRIVNLILDETTPLKEIYDKKSRAQNLYVLWAAQKNNKSIAAAAYVFTPTDLTLIHQYRYENDLMTPEESDQYENELFKSTSSPKIS